MTEQLRQAVKSDLLDVAKYAIKKRIICLNEEGIISEEEGDDLLKENLDLIEGE